MSMEPGFRVADGLAIDRSSVSVVFQRGADGSVIATKVPNPCPTPDDVQVLFVIDPDSWASVLAYVSALGSTGEGYAAAQELHMGIKEKLP